jgi:hypothetical protein
MPKTPREDAPGFFTVTAVEFGGPEEGFFSYQFEIRFDKRSEGGAMLEGTPEQQIKDWREFNTAPVGGLQVVKDEPLQVKGHTGWEIVCKNHQEKQFVRTWLVHFQQGKAVVTARVPETPDWVAAADKFFTSFTPLGAPPASASPQTPAADKPVEMTAEQLGQEDLDKGEAALDDTYKGKTLRVRGKVESVLENYVYLGTRLKHKEGQPVKVVMIFPQKAEARKFKAGTMVVIEGTYELAGVFGPSFKECRLVKKE